MYFQEKKTQNMTTSVELVKNIFPGFFAKFSNITTTRSVTFSISEGLSCNFCATYRTTAWWWNTRTKGFPTSQLGFCILRSRQLLFMPPHKTMIMALFHVKLSEWALLLYKNISVPLLAALGTFNTRKRMGRGITIVSV